MLTLLHILTMFLGLGISAYKRLSLQKSLGLIALSLLAVSAGTQFLLAPWLILLVITVVSTTPGLRQSLISKPVLDIFRKVLPPMNQTEKDALEAGDVWVDGDLFQGDPDWRKINGIERPELSPNEQSFVDNEVEQLCALIDDWQTVYKDKDLSQEVWQYLKEKGFFGMIIPKKYGGLEFSALAHSAIVTKLASRSVSAAVTAMVPNSLGPAELLMHYGTEQQKDHYLPRLATGDEIPCFALTGPEAGSDAGAIPDMGVVCRGIYQGEETLGIKLTWNKRYITLAPVATVLGLAFKLFDPEKLLSDETERGITVALIPTNHPGVEIGNRHIPMGMAFMNGPTRGKDVFIPLDWVIGGKDYIGKGWRMLVECLSAGRAISLPALSTASGQMSYRLTGAYAKVRKQFKMEIGKFEGVEESLARIAGYTYQLEASRRMTAQAVDLGVKPSVVSAIAKYHMTELGRKVVSDSMDVHAGRALIQGERNYLANAYISSPIAITVEGANILTRNLMIFGQGAVRCHPFVFDEMQAAANPDRAAGLRQFDKLLFSHIGYGISNFIRTCVLSVTGARFVSAPVSGETARYYQQLTRMSSVLALVSDLSMMILGGDLKRRERLSARLGDVLSYLYLSTTVLKYYEDNGRQVEDLPYVHWNLQNNLYNSYLAFSGFFDNFGFPVLSRMLKRLAFPLGNPYKLPSDKLDRALVKAMSHDGAIRERLTACTYVGSDDNDVAGRMENAFQKALLSAPIEKELARLIKKGKLENKGRMLETAELALTLGLISEADCDTVKAAEKARYDAIQVDDYTKTYVASNGKKDDDLIRNPITGDDEDDKAA